MAKVIIFEDQVKRLLGTPETKQMLARKAQRVADRAHSTAPVGAADKELRLRDSHRVIFDPTRPTGRARFLVVAEKRYASRVAARNNWLGAALSAARGE